MWKRIKNAMTEYPKNVGIIFTTIGILLLWIIVFITFTMNKTNENISSISVLVSISLGLISIGIAIISINLSKGSDEKMIAITKYHYSEIMQIIYDYLNWCEKNKDADKSIYQEKNDIYGWLIIAKRADIFKNWFDEREKNAISIGFTMLVKNWIDQYKRGLLTETEIPHITRIFEFCKESNIINMRDIIEVNEYLDELKKKKKT